MTVGYNTIKIKCYGERLEPNLKEMTIVKKNIIYRPIFKSARKYKQIYKVIKEKVGSQIRNTCSPFSQKRTDRKIGPVQRGPFVPKEMKTKPVVPFHLSK